MASNQVLENGTAPSLTDEIQHIVDGLEYCLPPLNSNSTHGQKEEWLFVKDTLAGSHDITKNSPKPYMKMREVVEHVQILLKSGELHETTLLTAYKKEVDNQLEAIDRLVHLFAPQYFVRRH